MDYVEVFKNLRTNNKYGRKSPHKAILMLSVIELFESGVLSQNEIHYDDSLKEKFLEVWNRVLPKEKLFHPEAYLPYWYLQSDSFWHIIPKRGEEDILSIMRDTNVKPSEARLYTSVDYAELDDDLYFFMTMPSVRKSLKRAILETYTNLSEDKIELMIDGVAYNDHYVSPQVEIDSLKRKSFAKDEISNLENLDPLEANFKSTCIDLQIALNFEYYSFLKKHRDDREWFLELFPSVYSLYNHLVNHPLTASKIGSMYVSAYEDFLYDLRISLMSEDCAFEMIDKLSDAIDCLHTISSNEEIPHGSSIETNKDVQENTLDEENQESAQMEYNEGGESDLEIEHVYLDSNHNIVKTISMPSVNDIQEEVPEKETRRGKNWTQVEEDLVARYFQQGIDTATIASNFGRTEVAIKSRLAKLGLMDYTYGQDDDVAPSVVTPLSQNGFKIENLLASACIQNKYGEVVFRIDGKLKYLGGKLYRLKLQNACFTIKSMAYDNGTWMKGTKKIVAYPQTKLYKVIDDAVDYVNVVEDIVDGSTFDECRVKVDGVWYDYQGYLLSESSYRETKQEELVKMKRKAMDIRRDPLYAVRKQAILRAMDYFHLPAEIREISRTISRTAWRTAIDEQDVADVISTISEIECVDGKYFLRKKK